MKKLLILAFSLVLTVTSEITPQQAYISRFSEVAVGEMYRSGVPASITIAQGLIESRAGQSDLAARGNNHFGIKCHDWKGKTMQVDDDRKGECFRVYDNPEDSYRDHSDFLRYRDRYKDLFDLEPTDYKAWAHGLKKAGYATDPQYASKLIDVIERYDLSRFDCGSADSDSDAGEDLGEDAPEAVAPLVNAKGKASFKHPERAKRPSRRKRDIPVPPRVLEEPVLDSKADEVFHFSTQRKVYSVNGVRFVYSAEGESYASIAADYNLFIPEILRFNDLPLDRPLAPGTMVFIASKKGKAAKGVDKYIVETDGMDLRDVSQRFGVKMSSLLKMNGFASGHVLYEGDTIVLR